MGPSPANQYGIRTSTGPRAWAGLAASTGVIVLFGLVLVAAVQGYLQSLNQMAALSPEAAIYRAGWSLRILALVLGGLAIGTSIYTAQSCRRVLAYRQLPPPGAWVIGNPTVISGTRAAVWGMVGYALAAMLAVVSLTFTYLMWQYVDLMMSGVI